jgi:hypothetical protein
MMPAKALKAGAALRMRMLADNAAWIARYQAATERLKAKESAVQAGASAEEDVEAGDATQQYESVEAAPGATELGRSRGDGQELGSTLRTLEIIETEEATTSARDAGQADAEDTRNVGETP